MVFLRGDGGKMFRLTENETKNHERFYVYGAWWKSKDEILFCLDGKHVYSVTPSVDWDVPAFIQMAIEVYDWVRTWELSGTPKK